MYNHLQPINNQIIYNHLTINYNESTMDVQITTIYNTFSAIDLQMHPFRINVQSIIYNPFTMINNDLQPIDNDVPSFTTHLQPINNDLQ